MAPRKKKLAALKIPEDEISLSRRSSLQVNLSFVTNLSDSGHGSFKSTQPETDVSLNGKSRMSLRRLASLEVVEKSSCSVPTETPMMNEISEKEKVLSESCRQLRDAIMSKTRQIFDGEAEFAVKTVKVLKGPRQALKEINEDPKIVGTQKNTPSPGKICSPPGKKRWKEDSRRKTLTLNNSNINESFILGGSDKSRENAVLRTKEKVLRVNLTRIVDPRLEDSIDSSISDIGAPVMCSSFMSGHGHFGNRLSQQAEKELPAISENFEKEDTTRYIDDSSFTPMEITAFQVPAPCTSKKTSMSLKLKTQISKGQDKILEDRSFVEVIPMEFTDAQSHVPSCQTSSTDRSVRTSLNVNTSKNSSSYVQETKESGQTPRTTEDVDLPNDPAPEISLKVNTSVGTIEQRASDKGTTFSCEESDVRMPENVDKQKTIISDSDSDSIDNMSLVARLRNISSKKQGADRPHVGEGPSFVEGTPYPPSRSILWKTQIKSETSRIKKNGTWLREQFAKTLAKCSKILSDADSSNSSPEYLTAPNSTIILGDSPCRINCNLEDPRIIEDSSEEDGMSKRANANGSSNAPDAKDSVNGLSASETVFNDSENITQGVPITRKKKLLPLRDNYEIVSFSPVSLPEPPPKEPVTWKPRKHFRKRKNTRAVAEKRIETLIRENEDEDDEPTCSNADEVKTQKVQPKTKKRRKVISKKIIVEKIADRELMERLNKKNNNQSTNDSRSSMNEFLEKKKLSVDARNAKPEKLIIVATGFSKGDVDLVKSIIKELGGAEINPTVTRRTTHVVSTGVRTINLLRGIIRGCWMVSLDWVLQSLEKREWLNAEAYEIIHFSKAVQENRRDRQIFGKAYVPELFTTCGPIHIEHGTSPPPNILKELVKTAGGRIAENAREARLTIGLNGLREIWILDSITTGDLQPIEEYQRK